MLFVCGRCIERIRGTLFALVKVVPTPHPLLQVTTYQCRMSRAGCTT